MPQRKNTTKKVTASATKQKKRRTVVKAPPHGAFWVYFGPILGDVYDLERCLKTITEDQFLYHVNQKKNDFAKWVSEMLRDKELSQKLLTCKTKDKAYAAVTRYVKTHY